MRISLFCYIALMVTSYQPCKSLNAKLLEVVSDPLSNVMKEFINRIIEENCQEKNGFLFVNANQVESEYSDFAVKKLNENASVIIFTYTSGKNRTVSALNPNHVKFALVDPEGDISHGTEMFAKIKVSRAKTVVVLTKKPLQIFVDYILQSYWKIQSLNNIVAYESNGRIEVITYNPYLPYHHQKLQNVTNLKSNFFYDKTKNLYGSKINCLLTYRDRTKVKRRHRDDGSIYYEGKDYIAIHTILLHLNGHLQMVTMDYVLLNPWYESLNLGNKTFRKRKILQKEDISILIKSEQFSDDELLDNLYPHTQNDLSSLVPKSSEIPMGISMTMVYTPSMWLTNLLLTLVFLLLWAIIKKLFRKTYTLQKLYFDIYRILIVNSVVPFPKRSVERLLIFGFILTSSIVNMFLQSRITSYLAIRKYYPDINTIEDLFSSGLPLYSIPSHIEEVKKKYVGTQYEEYAESLIPLTSNEGLMDQMTYRADVSQMPAFLTEHDIAVFVARCRNFHKNGAQVYHLVKESLIPNYQSYKVIHNSPLLPILNKNLRKLGEGGFIKLWAERTIYNATVEGFLYPEGYDDSESIKPLSLDVVGIWFYILLGGYTLSTCAFIAEILVQ